MLAANIGGDFAGIAVFGNIYGVAITTVIPTLIGVLVGYYALRRYIAFSFWDMYRVGYNEIKELIQQQFRKRFNPNPR